MTNALSNYIIDQTALGNANFIFVDVSDYESGYSMKGLYRTSGDDVEVRGKVFEGKAARGEFRVTGKKTI